MTIVRIYGDKPFDIVLIHGGPGAGGEMAPIARVLSKHRGILEPIQTKKSIKGQILELKEVIEKYCLLPVILIGYSWGAWLSLLFSAQNQESVKKVIIIGSGPFDESYIEELHETRMSRLNSKEREEFNKIASEIGNVTDIEKKQFLKRLGKLASKTDNLNPLKLPENDHFHIKNSGEIYQKVWSEASNLRKSGQLLARIKSLRLPVTALHGDYDPHPLEGVSLPLEQNLLNFKIHILKRCGHTPWLEKEAVDEFYKTLIYEIANIE